MLGDSDGFVHAYGMLAAIAGRERRKHPMAILKLSFKKAEDGILFHGFMSNKERAAEKMQRGHAEVCPDYGPEFKKGNTIETELEIEAVPEFDAEAIDEWVGEMFGLDDDEEDEIEESDEREPDEE